MDTIETLKDTIDSYFNGAKTDRESQLAFINYRDMVLASIPEMDAEYIREQPASVAIGFLGKMEFKEGKHLNSFIASPDMKTLAVLRENGVVAVADSARPAWTHLMATHPEAACAVLSLCALARKNTRVAALKPKVKKPS
jgi:hypothetical protein